MNSALAIICFLILPVNLLAQSDASERLTFGQLLNHSGLSEHGRQQHGRQQHGRQKYEAALRAKRQANLPSWKKDKNGKPKESIAKYSETEAPSIHHRRLPEYAVDECTISYAHVNMSSGAWWRVHLLKPHNIERVALKTPEGEYEVVLKDYEGFSYKCVSKGFADRYDHHLCTSPHGFDCVDVIRKGVGAVILTDVLVYGSEKYQKRKEKFADKPEQKKEKPKSWLPWLLLLLLLGGFTAAILYLVLPTMPKKKPTAKGARKKKKKAK